MGRADRLTVIYLLADSQLLFWTRHGRPLLADAVDGSTRAAYVGASNGDRPEFYEIFEAAMDRLGIADRRMIDSSFGPDDRAFLAGARLIVLAGGDVQQGWATLAKTGMSEVILDRYSHGAVLVGISAGAIQLGRYGMVGTPELLDVFDLVPFVIDAHDEDAGWVRLSQAVHLLHGAETGLGIPSGGGLVVHADGTVEALRRPARLLNFDGTGVTDTPLYPIDG
jgi:cyanophycinase-like exopeptidase